MLELESFLDVTSVLIFALVGLFSFVAYSYLSGPRNLPPSPGWTLPFVGHGLYFLDDKTLPKNFERWTKEHGGLLTMYLGRQLVIFVTGYDEIKEIWIEKEDNFMNRRQNDFFGKLSEGKGLFNANGHVWKENRRFTLHTLRNFGMGKSKLEDQMHDEAFHLLKFIDECKPIMNYDQIVSLTNRASANVISALVFGRRFDYSDRRLIRNVEYVNGVFSTGPVGDLYPFFKYWPWDVTGVRRFMAIRKDMIQFLNEEMNEHMRTLDVDNIRDIIDAYILEMNNNNITTSSKSTDNDSNFVTSGKGGKFTFDPSQLRQIIEDLFGAGTFTTSNTLRWALYFMIQYPDIQERVREEIEENLGLNRLPSMKDKLTLPYSEATILEIQRLGAIVVLGVGNVASNDVTVAGYTIPKGAWVLNNLNALLHNDKYFPDPFKFKPERFLDSNGKVKKIEQMIPFFVGKRNCAGESLVKMELWLFFTRLLQKFRLSSPPGVMCPPYKQRGIIIAEPPRFDMFVELIK